MPAVLRPVARLNVTAPAVVGARTFFSNSDFKQQEIKGAHNLLEQLSDNGLSPYEFVQKMEVIEKTSPSFLNRELQAKVQSYIDLRIEENDFYMTHSVYADYIVKMASVLDYQERVGLVRHLFTIYSTNKVLHEVDPKNVIEFFSPKDIEAVLEAHYQAGTLSKISLGDFAEKILPHLESQTRMKSAQRYVKDHNGLPSKRNWLNPFSLDLSHNEKAFVKKSQYHFGDPRRLLHPYLFQASFYTLIGWSAVIASLLMTFPLWAGVL